MENNWSRRYEVEIKSNVGIAIYHLRPLLFSVRSPIKIIYIFRIAGFPLYPQILNAAGVLYLRQYFRINEERLHAAWSAKKERLLIPFSAFPFDPKEIFLWRLLFLHNSIFFTLRRPLLNQPFLVFF